MHYQITPHGNYLRAVIADAADLEEFMRFYRELQTRCVAGGFDRALVVVRPEHDVPRPDRLGTFARAGFIEGFRLALVCASWSVYQGCKKAETAATQAAIHVRAFMEEMEADSWLTTN